MTSTTQAAPSRGGGYIPVAPLRQHIQRRIDSFGEDAVEDCVQHGGSSTPAVLLAERVWPGDPHNSRRRLHSVMNESEWISFDLADRIITIGLEEPWLWRSDDELAEAYQTVDLRALDASKPTCPKVGAKIVADVLRVYGKCGSVHVTVAETGVSRCRVEQIVFAPETACA